MLYGLTRLGPGPGPSKLGGPECTADINGPAGLIPGGGLVGRNSGTTGRLDG